jgi:uncharacterized protein (DUF433 family)
VADSPISFDPEILGGKPCIRGTRISVEFILELISSGATADDVVHAYPQLTRDDVSSAVRFAANFLRDTVLDEVAISS